MPLMQGASYASTNYSQTPLLNFPDLTGSNNRSASFAKYFQRLIVASLSFFLHSCKVNDFILTQQINRLFFFAWTVFLYLSSVFPTFLRVFSHSSFIFVYIINSLFFLLKRCKGRREVRRNTAEVDKKRDFLRSHAKKS